MEKFVPPETKLSPEALKVADLQQNVDSLKNVIQIVSTSGLEALKTIFKK